MSENLAEGLLREIRRNRKLLDFYKTLPPESSWFTTAMISASITRAENVMASGDVIAMLRSFNELKENE